MADCVAVLIDSRPLFKSLRKSGRMCVNRFQRRIKQYNTVSTSLSCFSNERLEQILADAKPMHEGIGGKSALISIDETQVFVKKIPLTDLEQLPQNVMSTANFFNLPMCYQYGIGSGGFGAWRELAAHIMTTNWVIANECANFPIMYHWRILASDISLGYWEDIEEISQYWENSGAIRKRVEELNKATANVILFLEYIPQHLYQWLNVQIAKGGFTADSAITSVDEQLKTTNAYMNSHGLMHFDAHFENILTDGELIYLSDFGLALSSEFELTKTEIEFLRHHKTYDQACAAVNLLHCIITALFGKERWEISLHEYIEGKRGELAPSIATIIKRYAPIALEMDTFFQKLQKESKSTPYPAIQIEKLLRKISEETKLLSDDLCHSKKQH